MTRKRVEVLHTLARNPTTTRTLRVFVSHTASGQSWQLGEGDGEGDAVTLRRVRMFQRGHSKSRGAFWSYPINAAETK
ncbi:hypothetical protein V8E55_009840 [Tylopilus felleus]